MDRLSLAPPTRAHVGLVDDALDAVLACDQRF
jgi:hypothetical protein